MQDKSILIIVGVLVAGVIAFATGFTALPLSENPWIKARPWMISSGEPTASARTDASQRTVEASGATTAKVVLEQGIGEMNVQGTSGEFLMDGTFDTTPKQWLPSVDYSVEGSAGTLLVKQPEITNTPIPGDTNNSWQIGLSQTMPIDLTIKRGVGEGTIDLSSVNVTAVRGQLGVGETTFDLSGARAHDVSVDLQGGVGQLKLIVPSGMAVRIVAEKGLGEISTDTFKSIGNDTWVNELESKGGPTMTVHVQQGIGEVKIESTP